MNCAGLRSFAQGLLQQKTPCVMVTVTYTRGSAPREAGAVMLVTMNNATGTIGGGSLEASAIEHARSMLQRTNTPVSVYRTLALGPSLGQCCGGSVELRFDWLDARRLEAWTSPQPLFHLQLHGAGHVGRAIVSLLSGLEVHVDWIDQREDQFDLWRPSGDTWPASIRRICVDDPHREVARALPGTFFLVLTHSHALDLEISRRILSRADFAFFGLIGSKTKRTRFEHRLSDRGLPERALTRMTCPIGLPGIEGKAPNTLAIAIVAQLLERAGRPQASGVAPCAVERP